MSLNLISTHVLGLALVSCLLTGCGGGSDAPDRYTLEGSIVFDGQPIPAGTITLIPDSGKGNSGPAGSARIKDGKFTTAEAGTGVVGGSHIIRVKAFDGNPKPDEELPLGSPLFPEYEFQYDLPEYDGTSPVSVDLKVPKSAKNPKPKGSRRQEV
ncbi:hypothetical protein [Thalassoroseus pseudoceratinae]|uniref:hypothetical protein n=1 Tax=Thalassoroseus pseudoceratinae TaxID=2713176 RepID=UPI001424315B|nr:hypothetical protein [Thalassoroseus pseudoceratinae]